MDVDFTKDMPGIPNYYKLEEHILKTNKKYSLINNLHFCGDNQRSFNTGCGHRLKYYNKTISNIECKGVRKQSEVGS